MTVLALLFKTGETHMKYVWKNVKIFSVTRVRLKIFQMLAYYGGQKSVSICHSDETDLVKHNVKFMRSSEAVEQ